jgi:hypothetical protein
MSLYQCILAETSFGRGHKKRFEFENPFFAKALSEDFAKPREVKVSYLSLAVRISGSYMGV